MTEIYFYIADADRNKKWSILLNESTDNIKDCIYKTDIDSFTKLMNVILFNADEYVEVIPLESGGHGTGITGSSLSLPITCGPSIEKVDAIIVTFNQDPKTIKDFTYDYPEDLKEEFPEKYSEECKFDFLRFNRA